MKTKYIGAGAGSGKTHRLTHDLADRLTEGDKPLNASRIILTTFTKAAAEDFVKKAREVLIKEKHNPAKAAELDSALIGTVHSVCEKFVKKYWYRLGLTLPLNLIPGDNQEHYISRTAESVANDDDVKFFTRFAWNYEMDSDFWKEYLKRIVEMKFHFGVDDFSESRKASHSLINEIYSSPACPKCPENIKAFLNILLVVDRDYRNSTTRQKKLKALLADSVSDFTRVRKTLSLINLDDGLIDDNQGLWSMMEEKMDLLGLVRDAQNYLVSESIGEPIKKCVDKLFDLAVRWAEEYKRFKDEYGLLDFNDLEEKFIRILYEDEFEDVRQDIRNSYDLLMVDEFQDSNPVQIKIFRKLMELVEETMFVGDYKQAIFGFRGTESSLVEDFIKGIPNHNQESLKESFRSRQELVEAANDIFCQAFGVERKEVFPKDPKKPYDGVSLKHVRSDWKELGPALQHWDMPNSKNGYTAVGKKIHDLVNSETCMVVTKDKEGKETLRKLQYGDIAILLRNAKYHINDVVQSLREAKVPVSVQEDNFMEWAESQLILSLLRYVNDANDRCAKADILHLIGGVSSRNVIASCAISQITSSTTELFKHLEDIRSRISVLSISEIVETLALELDLYFNVADWGNSVTRARNISFMVGLAQQYAQQCETMNTTPSLPGYIAFASEFKPEKRSIDKTNTVKVLTCHNAKGLQWPMVILDQLDSLDLSDQSFYKKEFSGVQNYRKGNIILLQVLPAVVSKDTGNGYGNRSNLPRPLLDKMVQTEYYEYLRKRKIEEETRLLYVSFTRAQDYLVTLGNENSNYTWPKQCNACSKEKQPNNALQWHPNHPSTLFDLQEPEKPKEVQEDANETETKDKELKAWKVPAKPDSNDKYISPSQAGTSSIPVRLKELFHGEKMVQNIHDAVDTLCGTCIHRIFAAFDPDGDRNEMVEMAGRIITGMGLTQELPSPESVVDSAAQFFGWIRQTYGAGTPLHELPFENRQSDGTIIRGEMDLVWELPDKKCVLVDYKSFHGCEELSGIKAHAVQHGYPAQLKAYKETLEAGDYEVRDVLIYYFVQGKIIRFEF